MPKFLIILFSFLLILAGLWASNDLADSKILNISLFASSNFCPPLIDREYLGTFYRCSAEKACGSDVIQGKKYREYILYQAWDGEKCVNVKREYIRDYYEEKLYKKGSPYQQCQGSASQWVEEPPPLQCQGECYPTPVLKPLDQIPEPPHNVADESSWKLPINFAWEDLNKKLAKTDPSCQVDFYQFQIPGVDSTFPPSEQPPPGELLPPPPPPPPGEKPLCSTPEKLAAHYQVPYPAQAAPMTEKALKCIEEKLGRKLIEGENMVTYDHTHEVCNYTRGYRICGPCSHAIHSCHYGGRDGYEGALAIDIFCSGKSECQHIRDVALSCSDSVKAANCDKGGKFDPECEIVDHIHVTAKDCGGI